MASFLLGARFSLRRAHSARLPLLQLIVAGRRFGSARRRAGPRSAYAARRRRDERRAGSHLSRVGVDKALPFLRPTEAGGGGEMPCPSICMYY